ncbi:imidazole glycerol phosphate synthase subunit HisF [Polynucleobacter paneuropaeus]|nr:imidazole glycerol phosphate synthase subunit HisF [Polynucleobacter paneuropaeus]
MLKKRIIPVELLLGGRLVKTLKFDTWRDVGDPLKSSQVYSDQDADELIILNIDRDQRNVVETASYIRDIAGKCFMPLAVGGGINSLQDAKVLFDAGADKVVINSAAYSNLDLLNKIAQRWGNQAIVISIDVLRDETSNYSLKSNCGRSDERVDLISHVKSVVNSGAGEILVNSINDDGVMNGYDCRLIDILRPLSSVPLIICGGAGNYSHLKDAFSRGANAAACGSLFNFGDNNPLRAKAFLKNYEVPLKRI